MTRESFPRNRGSNVRLFKVASRGTSSVLAGCMKSATDASQIIPINAVKKSSREIKKKERERRNELKRKSAL